MASDSEQKMGENSNQESISDVLRKVIALRDRLTVTYRDKDGQVIGRTVSENHIVEEQEGCDPGDSRVDSVEIQSGTKNWKFNHDELADFRKSY